MPTGRENVQTEPARLFNIQRSFRFERKSQSITLGELLELLQAMREKEIPLDVMLTISAFTDERDHDETLRITAEWDE